MTISNVSKQQCVRGVAIAFTAAAILAAAVSVVALGVLLAPATFAFAAVLGTVTLLPLVGVVAVVVTAVTTALAIYLFVQASRLGRRPLDGLDDLELDDNSIEDGVKSSVNFQNGQPANSAFVLQLNKLFLARTLKGFVIGDGDDAVDVSRTAQGSASFIHFQTVEKVKLSVEVDIDGVVCSATVDGEDVEINDIFSVTARSSWAKKLGVLIREFANENGVTVDSRDYIGVHPFALQYAPDIVLNKIFMLNIPIYRKVSFLSDALKHSPAVDAGGLSAQFLTSLSRYLFTSSVMDPTIFCLTDDEQTLTRNNIGNLFSYCFASTQNEICAPILPISDFALIQELLPKGKKKLSSSDIAQAAKHLVTTNHEKNLLAFLAKIPDPITDPEGSRGLSKILENYVDDDDMKEMTPNEIKDILEKLVDGLFRPKVEMMQQIACGMDTSQHPAILALTPAHFRERIQGKEFNAEYIASLIFTTDPNKVVNKKMKWIQEFIETKNKSWVLDFLESVTGKRSVTAATRIEVSGTTEDVCAAHTCFSRIDVPDKHVTYHVKGINTEGMSEKEKFFVSVSLMMEEKGFTDA